MESDNTLIQKLRGLLPEKTAPFIITDLSNQLETAFAGDGNDDQEKQEQSPLHGAQPDDILNARIDEKFYTREKGKFELTELSLYRIDPVGSVFITKELSHGLGLGYYQAYNQVISKVISEGSRYKPIYRRVDLSFQGNIGTKTFYCLMGAAIPKTSIDKAAEV